MVLVGIREWFLWYMYVSDCQHSRVLGIVFPSSSDLEVLCLIMDLCVKNHPSSISTTKHLSDDCLHLMIVCILA